jgi:hypothetical protein
MWRIAVPREPSSFGGWICANRVEILPAKKKKSSIEFWTKLKYDNRNGNAEAGVNWMS